ncbi:hypothetical protein NL676_018522 [Syzygium grande]|nr:hypothetical protein NL676_018522 [Syzygium grande]
MASRNQTLEDPNDEADGSDFSDADEESNVTIRRRVFSLLYLDDEYPPRPMVNQASFWDKASKCIPTKSIGSILSYYYNVFVPKRITMQLRSSTEQINSDEAESEE